MRRKLAILAAVFLSSTALAGHGLELTPSSDVYQYGDSLYTTDLESGGAVRIGAIWDGFSPAREADTVLRGDFVYQRNTSGEYVKVEAVWDGRVAAIEPATTLASSR